MPSLEDAIAEADRLCLDAKPLKELDRAEKRRFKKLLEIERELQDWMASPQGQVQAAWRAQNEKREQAKQDRRAKARRAWMSLAEVLATDGDPRLDRLQGEPPEPLLRRLNAAARSVGYSVVVEAMHGSGRHGYCRRRARMIVLADDLNAAQRAYVLAHELGHAYDAEPSHDTQGLLDQEIVAETTAHIICSVYDFDLSRRTAAYTNYYVAEGVRPPTQLRNRIDTTALTILDVIPVRQWWNKQQWLRPDDDDE